mgnify:CR=1 FL=1
MTEYKKAEEIWEEKNKFDFDALLEPYCEGGTQNAPVRRTVGTMLDYLINKKQYPVDVAGAGFLLVFKEMFDGKNFKGDGSYGSPGRELMTYVRMKCDEINQRKLRSKVFETIAGARMQALEELAFQTVRQQLPWFICAVAPNTWEWRRKRKLRKAKEKDAVNRIREQEK